MIDELISSQENNDKYVQLLPSMLKSRPFEKSIVDFCTSESSKNQPSLL